MRSRHVRSGAGGLFVGLMVSAAVPWSGTSWAGTQLPGAMPRGQLRDECPGLRHHGRRHGGPVGQDLVGQSDHQHSHAQLVLLQHQRRRQGRVHPAVEHVDRTQPDLRYESERHLRHAHGQRPDLSHQWQRLPVRARRHRQRGRPAGVHAQSDRREFRGRHSRAGAHGKAGAATVRGLVRQRDFAADHRSMPGRP